MSDKISMRNNYAVLVCSCDSYADTWKIFFDLIERYWPDKNTRFYLSTEALEFRDREKYEHHISVLKSEEKGGWGGRIKEALDRIQEEYVLLLCDDFFVTGLVRTDHLEKLVEKFELNRNIVACQLAYSRNMTHDNHLNNSKKVEEVRAESKTEFYPTLWRKEILCKWLRRNESIWGFELEGAARAKRWKYEGKVLRVNEPCIYPYLWLKPDNSAIINGKWYKSERLINFFREENLNISFEDRGFITNEEYSNRDWKYILSRKSLKQIVVRMFWRIVYFF